MILSMNIINDIWICLERLESILEMAFEMPRNESNMQKK